MDSERWEAASNSSKKTGGSHSSSHSGSNDLVRHLPGPARQAFLLQRYTVLLLSGLASVGGLGLPEGELLEAERAILKDTWVREVGSETTES